MSKSSSILMLMNEYQSVSGHGNVVNNISLGLMDLGYDVTIAARTFLDSPPKEIKTEKIKLIDILRGYCNKYDIVHCHQGLMNYCSLFTKKPFIFHYHGTTSLSQRINTPLSLRICKKHISKIICVSESSCNWLKNRIINYPMTIVNNGINTTKFKPKDIFSNHRKGNPQLLFVGNLYKTKKVFRLIELMNSLIDELPNTHLIIVGDGDEFSNLKKLTTDLNLHDKIMFAGRISGEELIDYYHSSDIYVSAGENESNPIPPKESMACGKPVILSDIPQHLEIVKNSNAGRCFSTKDSEDFKNQIKFVSKNLESFSDNCVNYALKHDWKIKCKEIVNIYEELMKNSK